jgi:hypothetical protein
VRFVGGGIHARPSAKEATCYSFCCCFFEKEEENPKEVVDANFFFFFLLPLPADRDGRPAHGFSTFFSSTPPTLEKILFLRQIIIF